MTRTLVIGFGNTLRGDDGAGQLAAARIAELHPDLTCFSLVELTPELADTMSVYDRVVFIDASVGIETLRWHVLRPSVERTQPRSHALTPGDLLQLTIELFNYAPQQVELVEIPASQFGFCEEMSIHTRSMIENFVGLFGETMDLHAGDVAYLVSAHVSDSSQSVIPSTAN